MSKQYAYNEMIEFVGPIYTGKYEWKRGDLLSTGEVCSVYKVESLSKLKGDFIIKIGPATSLFYEQSIFRKLLDPEELYNWEKKNNKAVALPEFTDAGRKKDIDVYFIVTEKLTPVRLKIPIERHILPLLIGDIICALEYLHAKGFVHGNIKLDNIMWKGESFHLNSFKHSAKHNSDYLKKLEREGYVSGTLKYAGTDAHITGFGPTIKGEMENLIFCIIEWCGGKLPWANEADTDVVLKMKQTFLANPKLVLESCDSRKTSIYNLINYIKRQKDCSELDYGSLIPDMFKKPDVEYEEPEPDFNKKCCSTCEQLFQVHQTLLKKQDRKAHRDITVLKELGLWKLG